MNIWTFVFTDDGQRRIIRIERELAPNEKREDAIAEARQFCEESANRKERAA